MQERRTAIVTGGRLRVGRQISQTLAEAGFDVIYTTRHPAPPTFTPAGGGRIDALSLDVTELPASADALKDAVQSRLDGRLDVLVHNASAYEPGNLQKVSLQQIRCMNRIHVETPILLTQQLAPYLKASRGHVIMMSDITAERPMPSHIAYCASKAALSNLTLSLARALAPEVTVNAIAPGIIQWPDDLPQAERDAYVKRVPLKHAGTPEDAARLVRFLVTDGGYITGQVIRLDGGRSIV